MTAFAIVLAAWAAPAAGLPQVPGLVAKLGHPEFAEREAAAKALAAVGEPALPALRAGLAAEDPEVARRAAGLVAAVTRRAEDRRLLAPTLVTLAAPGGDPLTLGQVARDWRKASGVEFALAPAGLGDATVVSRTAAPVPLWEAVELVAAELDLDIRAGPADQRFTVAVTPRTPRDKSSPERFAAQGHALAVAAVPPSAGVALPKDSLSVIVQTFAEPSLRLQRLDAVVVTKAVDGRGRELRTLPAVLRPPPPVPTYRGRGRGLRGGGAIVFDAEGVALVPGPLLTNFAPTASQALLRFAVPDPAPAGPGLEQLEGVLRATVLTPNEALARVTGIDKVPLSAGGSRAVSLTVQTTPFAGEGATLVVTVVSVAGETVFGADPASAAAIAGAERARADGLPTGPPVSALAGLSVTDAAGEPFEVSAASTVTGALGDGRLFERIPLRLQPTDKTRGAPTTVTLRGARTRPLDIPFTLRDVPLHPGTALAIPAPGSPPP